MDDDKDLEQLSRQISEQQEYIELLEAAIDLSMMGYVICDAQGNVLKINEAQGKITGWDPEAMLGKNMADIGKVDNHSTGIMKIIETQQPVKLERQLSTGKSFLVYGKPYFGADKKLKYAICNLVDTTEITQTKSELDRARLDNDQLTLRIQQLQSMAESDSQLIYHSQKMHKIIELCLKIAKFDSSVLIEGESGVGKELIADLIFKNSNRNGKPFIKINCASIPEHLLESELFGYEKGSFTGANSKGKKGLLECADQGTLLLDEIGEMSLPLQAKLLRFLQQGEFYHVGGHTQIKLDVRILAATNRDLSQMVKEGKFREDLFYRLNVISIKVPSLKERKEDIPLLIKFFNKKFNEKYGLNKAISLEVIDYFTRNVLRGNVRELQNTIERLLVLSEGETVQLSETIRILASSGEEENCEGVAMSRKDNLKKIMEEFEKELLIKYANAFKTTQEISEMLKVSQPTISRKLIKYGIKIHDMQK